MWAIGKYDLHLTEEEFWGLTARKYRALTERLQVLHDWENYRSALICAVMANIHRDPKAGKTYSPQDFMPDKPKQKQKQTPEQMLNMIKMFHALHEVKKHG